MAFSELGTYNAQPRTQRKPVAGPYRSQSSVPSIRRQATPREHRSLPYNPFNHVDHVVSGPSPLEQAVHAVASAPPPPHVSPPPIRHLLNPTGALDPYTAYSVAGFHGAMPSPATTRSLNWNSEGRKMLHAIRQEAFRYIQGHEGLQEDPLAEFAIGTLATAGLGAGINALKGGAEGAVAASEAASAASQGSKAVRVAEALRSAPTALKGLAESLTTSTGQKALARGAAERGAAQAVAHPILTKGAMLSAAHEAGVGGGFTGVPAALLVGHARALLHPTKTIPTTGRALAGALAAPLALLYSGIQSGVEGNPAAFTNTASGQIQGLGQIGNELLSGDPKTVQQAVENNVGLSFLAPVPALSRTGAWERVRSVARDTAKEARGRLNERSLQAGLPAPYRYGPGEQHVFGALERRAQRREASIQASRAYAPHTLEATQFTNAMLRKARETANARSARNIHGFTSGDLVHTLAELGTTREKALAHLADLEKTGLAGKTPRPGDVTLRAVLDEVKRNPKMLEDPKLWHLVNTYRESTTRLPSAKVEGGQRAARLLQARILGVQLPEHMVPEGVKKYTQATDRAGAWRDLHAREAQVTEFRKEARLKAAVAAHVPEAANATALKAESDALYAKARTLEGENKDFRKTLSQYSGRLRGNKWDQAISSRAVRMHWDPQQLEHFVKTVDQKAAERGYVQPVITHHAPLRHEAQFVGQGGNEATRVQHIRTTGPESLAGRDLVDRGLRGLVEGSVIQPRIRAAGKEYTRKMFSEPYVKPVRVGDKPKLDVTKEQFDSAVSRGEFSSRHYIWVPNRYYKQGFLDPFSPLEQLPEDVRASAKQVQAGSFGRKGELGRVMPLETFKEFAAQTDPVRNSAMAIYRTASRVTARTLLFSTGWVFSQIAAEGLPILMANPKLFNPAYLRQLHDRLRKAQDLSPQEAMSWGAIMGESRVRTAGAVQDLQDLGPMTRTHQMFYDAARAAEHNRVGRVLFSIGRQEPLQAFNVWQAGYFRKILAAAETDRSLNGFLHGLQGALHLEKSMSEELRRMKPEEQILAFTHPRYAKAMDQLATYIDDITGNWHAYTRFEKRFAPAMIFYGFLRYAMRWPLTFAKRHPVTATINYFLAQQNANEIRKILGEDPATFLNYSFPVVHGPDNKASVLPVGSRITPGLSGPSQGVLEGKGPAAIVGSLNPIAQLGLGLVTGETAFGTHDENEGAFGLHWSLAGNQLLSMPPIMRLFGVGQSNSPTAQQLRKNDPYRTLRSVVWPYLPESAEAFRANNQIINNLDNGSSSSSSSSGSGNPFDSVNPLGSSSSNPFDSVKLP